MVKLWYISVTSHMPQNWVSDTYYVCDINTINGVALAGCCELNSGESCGASLAFTVDLQSAVALPVTMSLDFHNSRICYFYCLNYVLCH